MGQYIDRCIISMLKRIDQNLWYKITMNKRRNNTKTIHFTLKTDSLSWICTLICCHRYAGAHYLGKFHLMHLAKVKFLARQHSGQQVEGGRVG